jgi:hypothetical protein
LEFKLQLVSQIHICQKERQKLKLELQRGGAPAAIRTRDPLLRRQMLYPTELRAHTDYQALASPVFGASQIVPRSTKHVNSVLPSMTKTEQKIDKPSVWEPTRYTNLFRYVPSGMIFARFKIQGKQVRKSLKTSNLELAKNKLAELERNERAIAHERRRGKMLFGEAGDDSGATMSGKHLLPCSPADTDTERRAATPRLGITLDGVQGLRPNAGQAGSIITGLNL